MTPAAEQSALPADPGVSLWRGAARWLAQPSNIFLLLVLASPLLAWLFGAPWYLSTALLLLGLILVAALLNRRGGTGLIGPHFFYDLVRLGRRPRTWDTRIVYAALLLLGIGLVYFFRFPLRDWESLFVSKGSIGLTEASNLAQRFAFTIVVLQNLAVFILAPAYLAPVIAEERENATLELLYTTHLRSHQILLGKFFARVVHLAVIFLGGLPILSLVQLWGGLDIPTLIANFVLTFVNLLAIGSAALIISVLSKRVVTAVMITYGVTLPLAFCFGGIALGTGESFMGMYELRWTWLGGTLFFHLPITATCLGGAIVAMRMDRLSEHRTPPRPPRRLRRKRPQPPPLDPALRAMEAEVERTPTILRERSYDLPPVSEADPLYWKEMSLGYRPFYKSPVFYTILGVALYIVVSVFLSLLVAAASERFSAWEEQSRTFGFVLRGLAVLYGTLLALGMGYYSAGTMVRERQAKTLDSLLTLPIERAEILNAKWLASVSRNMGWLLCCYLVGVLGLVTSSVHVAGAMLLAAVPVVYAAFFNSLGMYLSVVCRTLLEAYVKLGLLLFIIGVGSWLAGLALEFAGFKMLAGWVGVGMNPAWATWTVGFSYDEFHDPAVMSRLSGCLGGLIFFIVGAIGFWYLAGRAFQRERYRHVE